MLKEIFKKIRKFLRPLEDFTQILKNFKILEK